MLNALLLEELARGDAAAAVAIAAPLGFAKAVAEHGSEHQRRELLPLFAGGEPRLAAFAHVNSDGSKAPLGLRGRPGSRAAIRLKGRKDWIPLFADAAILCNRRGES